MKITETWTFPADPEAVWAMLMDPAFQEAKSEASGALSQEVSITPDDDGSARIEVHRVMPTDDLPSQLTKFLSDGLTIVEIQDWDAPADSGSRTGTVTVEIKGTPVGLTGDLTLLGEDDGTRMAVQAELKARIPLFGGQIEKAAAPAVVQGIRVEERVGRSWLAG